MKYSIKVDTMLEIERKEDLNKLRQLLEANNLDKPNFSKLARELNIDRRVVKKYYEGNTDKTRKPKYSKLDDYYDTIKELLSEDNIQKFHYIIHLYRYLRRENGLEISRSNFNAYILKHPEFAEYFNPQSTKNAVKTETPMGKQGQFDWKEKLRFTFSDGDEMLLNVGSLILASSRFKVWIACPAISQSYLFDFLSMAFEKVGGVPKELLIDNASTMMDISRTEKSPGKVNVRFQQFADDYGFEVKPCMRARPNTKAKVENPMRIIEEIMNYNGKLKDLAELQEKLDKITEEANNRICQGTGIPPILLYKKEKEHLLPLPNDKICSSYKIKTTQATVYSNGLFDYDKKQYSVPAEFIGKKVTLKILETQLQVYYNAKLITMHEISEKLINYKETDHLEMLKKTFKNKENLEEYAIEHLKELEIFNEQISEFM